MSYVVVVAGDSIVAGSNDTDRGGFRGPIQTIEAATGMDYAFQGSQNLGLIPEPYHEGISGDTIAMVAARINTAILTYTPDMVLLNVGINDCALALGTAAQIAANLMALVDQIHAWRAGCWVLVDTLTPNLVPATEALRVAVNALLPGLVDAQIAAGKKTMLVYAGSSINPLTQLGDSTHPIRVGYEQMAQYWADAMRTVVATLQAARVDDDLLLLGSVLYPYGDVMAPVGALFSGLGGMAPNHHVILGTTGLLLDKGGYSRSSAQQLAAQFSIAGLSNRDRITDQTATLSDWSGGEGYLVQDPAHLDRFKVDSGTDGFTVEGSLGLGPYLSSVAGVAALTQNAINCMIVYNGLLMLGLSNGKVYQWDGATLTFNYDTTKTAGIGGMMIHEGYLYVSTLADGVVYRWTAVTATTVWAANFTVGPIVTETITGVPWLSRHRPQAELWPMYAANGTGHALVGPITNTAGTTSPSDVDALHLTERAVGWMGQYRDRLIVIGNDTTARTWRLYDGSQANPMVWTTRGRVENSVVTAAVVLPVSLADNTDDILWLGDDRGQLWTFDGTRIRYAASLGSDMAPYALSILGMAAYRGALWISVRHADGTLGMRRFDGVSAWHRPVVGLSGTTPGVLAVYNDRLHMASNTTALARLYRADGTFAASGSVESSLIDADLPGLDKKWDRVFIRHSPLVAGQSVTVAYRMDDTGAWLTVGTSNVAGTTNASFDFIGAIVGELIAFRLTLTGVAAGSASPLTVYAMVASYRPAPEPKREWDLRVLLHGNRGRFMPLENGDTETRTGEELSAAVWALVDSNVPVTYLDIDRAQLYVVSIVGWSEHDATSQRIGLLGQGWELDGTLKLREV